MHQHRYGAHQMNHEYEHPYHEPPVQSGPRYSPTPESSFYDSYPDRYGASDRYRPRYDSGRYDRSYMNRVRPQMSHGQNRPVHQRREPPRVPPHQPTHYKSQQKDHYSADDSLPPDWSRRDDYYRPVSPPPPSQSSNRPYYSDQDYVEPRLEPRLQSPTYANRNFPPPPPPHQFNHPGHVVNRPPPPVNQRLNNSYHSQENTASPRAEVVVPDVRGVGTLAHLFEKSARLRQREIELSPPKPPPKPLFHRDEHRDRLRDIELEVNRSRPQYDYDYSQVDHFKPRSPTKHPITSPAAHSQPIHSQPTHSQLTHQHHDHQNQHHYHHSTSEMDVIVPPTQYEQAEPIYELPPRTPPPVSSHVSSKRAPPPVPSHGRNANAVHHPITVPSYAPVHHHPESLEVRELRPAERHNSATQTLPEPKEVQTDQILPERHEKYANLETLNIADLKPNQKSIPPRPVKPAQTGLLRNESKTNWSDASDFQYTPSPDSALRNQNNFYNHDYEDNASRFDEKQKI